MDFKCHLFFLDYAIMSFIIQNVHLRYSKSLPLNSVPQLPSSPTWKLCCNFLVCSSRDSLYVKKVYVIISLFIQMIECYTHFPISCFSFYARICLRDYYVAVHQEFPSLPLQLGNIPFYRCVVISLASFLKRTPKLFLILWYYKHYCRE